MCWQYSKHIPSERTSLIKVLSIPFQISIISNFYHLSYNAWCSTFPCCLSNIQGILLPSPISCSFSPSPASLLLYDVGRPTNSKSSSTTWDEINHVSSLPSPPLPCSLSLSLDLYLFPPCSLTISPPRLLGRGTPASADQGSQPYMSTCVLLSLSLPHAFSLYFYIKSPLFLLSLSLLFLWSPLFSSPLLSSSTLFLWILRLLLNLYTGDDDWNRARERGRGDEEFENKDEGVQVNMREGGESVDTYPIFSFVFFYVLLDVQKLRRVYWCMNKQSISI